MNGHPLHDKLCAMFKNELAVEITSCETDLVESGTLDSAMFIDLLFCLEDRFGVSTDLDDLDVENFSSIKRIALYIDKRTAATSQTAHSGANSEGVSLDGDASGEHLTVVKSVS